MISNRKSGLSLLLAAVITLSGLSLTAHADDKDRFRGNAKWRHEQKKDDRRFDRYQERRAQELRRERVREARRLAQLRRDQQRALNRFEARQRDALRDILNDRGRYRNVLDARTRAELRAFRRLPPGIQRRLLAGKSLPPGIANSGQFRYLPTSVNSYLGYPDYYRIGAYGDDYFLYNTQSNTVVDVLRNLLSGGSPY